MFILCSPDYTAMRSVLSHRECEAISYETKKKTAMAEAMTAYIKYSLLN